MKRAAAFLFAVVIGVFAWLNFQRMQENRITGLPGGDVLPPLKQTSPPAADGGNLMRAAAADVEQVVVNIDTVMRPVSIPDFGFLGSRYALPEGAGSGVVIRPDGFIVTNNHVVDNAQQIEVTFPNGDKVRGEIWGRDPAYDLAVVKVARSGLPAARLGDSSKIRVGDQVIAVGNALGLGTTVTSGIVSALERAVEGSEKSKGLAKAIQTDAAINRGNSGGALALLNGDIIGINTAILSTGPNGGNIGIGFAIPANVVRDIASQLIKNRKIERPAVAWVGLRYAPNSADIATALKQRYQIDYPSVTDGVIVMDVVSGAPAERAGVKVFDNILQLDGKGVNGEDGFRKAITAHKPGDRVKFVIYRPGLGKKITLDVRLSAAPEPVEEEEQEERAPRRSLPFPF